MGVVDATALRHHRFSQLPLLPHLRLPRFVACRRHRRTAPSLPCWPREDTYALVRAVAELANPPPSWHADGVHDAYRLRTRLPSLRRSGHATGRIRHYHPRINCRLCPAGHHLHGIHSRTTERDQPPTLCRSSPTIAPASAAVSPPAASPCS